MSDPGASPGLAFLLGFIPGVGAIYNGQYVKGLIHVVVFGRSHRIVNDDEMSGNLQPLFGMMIAVWVFYMAFEAYHTAKRRQLGQPVDEFSSIVPRAGHPARFPLAPTVLIAVGLLFLLHNLNILRIGELIRYWPVALICLGAYMLYERLSGHPPSSEHVDPARAAPGRLPMNDISSCDASHPRAHHADHAGGAGGHRLCRRLRILADLADSDYRVRRSETAGARHRAKPAPPYSQPIIPANTRQHRPPGGNAI